MNVHFTLENYNAINPAITIGSFDGLHKGHMGVLQHLKEIAQQCQGETVVISFWPHPRTVISGKNSELHLLTTLQEKIELFRQTGIDHLFFYPFTSELSKQTASSFFHQVLKNQLHACKLLIGYNQRFGHDRVSDFQTLNNIANDAGFEAMQYTAISINELKLSSSNIRHLIEQGEMHQASQLLGYHYSISGTVIVGNKLGRELGFPTANLGEIDSKKLLPLMGVYAVQIEIAGQIFGGMLNIGFRPTINGTQRTIEVHIFQFSENIYGKKIRVYFVHRIRNEKKFANLAELKAQLATDKITAIEILRENA